MIWGGKKLCFSQSSHLRLYICWENSLSLRLITSQCLGLTAVAQWPGKTCLCSQWKNHWAPSRWVGAWIQTLLLTWTDFLRHRALASFSGGFQKVRSLMGGQPEGNRSYITFSLTTLLVLEEAAAISCFSFCFNLPFTLFFQR